MTIDEINIPQATSSDFELVCKNTGKAYALADEVLIGQELDCTIRLKSPQIRRYHAKLNRSEDGLFLEDLNSQNNTYLNGCRIGTGAWVTLGDEINFNGAKFLIKAQNLSKTEHTPRTFNASQRPRTSQNTGRASAPVKHSPIELKPAPKIPFSNQDVVEATRALEARAKERLQLYKQEESILNPDWEAFIDKRQKVDRTSSRVQADNPSRAAPTSAKPTPHRLANETVKTSAALKPAVGEPLTKPAVKPNALSTATPRSAQPTSAKPIPRKKAPAEAATRGALTQTATNKPSMTQPSITKPAHTAAPINTPSPRLNDKNNISSANNNKSNNSAASRSITLPNIQVPAIEAANDVARETPTQPAAHKNTSVIASSGDTGSGPRLVVQTAPTRGKCYLLAPTDAKKVWTIGRADHADLQVSEEGIDLIHAQVELTDEHYTIRTTRSTNGMLINDTFKNEAALKAGDKIQFGRMAFEFRADYQSTPIAESEPKHKINYGLLLGSLVVLGALLIALTQSPF
ncbi:FHA domain-containing protein [Marinagarivorans algicola]|uniref:FHA domain-containing protein n=1 Tax=Marinagarivorans algicola TaxID=1513270 RepID=UPI003736DF93